VQHWYNYIATQQRSRTTVQKWNQIQVHPLVVDSPSLLRDTEVKVTLVNKPIAHTSCAKYVQVRTWYIHENNVCSFSNITWHRNILLPFMRALLSMVFGHRDIRTIQHETPFCGDFSRKQFIRITHDAWRNRNTTLNTLLPTLTQKQFALSHETLKCVDACL
jgi:hypothetical protein